MSQRRCMFPLAAGTANSGLRNFFLGFSLFFPIIRRGPIPGRGMTDEILTIREVADLLKINEKTAYKLASAGKIPGFKVGGSWRFERREIANWIKRKVEEQQRGNGSDH